MIKDNQKVFNRLLVIIDALITAVSFVLAYYIKFYILNDGPGIGVLPVQDYYMLLPFIVPGYMFLYYRCSVYSPKRTVRRRHEIYSILQANTIGLAALIIILYMIIREINFSRSVMAIFYVLNVFSDFRIPYHHAQGIAFHTEKGVQPEAHFAGRLFPSGGGIYRQNPQQSPMGICSVWYSG